MSNLPQVFSFESSEVRVIDRNGDPWFIASDACKVLGLANSRDAVLKLDADEKGVALTDTTEGVREVGVISESGLYTLILRCRDATTPGTVPHRFRKWVTSEVLPSIRKTGTYVAKQQPMTPSQIGKQCIIDMMDVAVLFGSPKSYAIQVAASEAVRQTGMPWDRLLTQAEAMNNVPHEDVYLEPTELGNLFELSAREMNAKLAEFGFQVKEGGEWRPTEAGSQFCKRHAWVRGAKGGYNLKWKAKEIEALMAGQGESQ